MANLVAPVPEKKPVPAVMSSPDSKDIINKKKSAITSHKKGMTVLSQRSPYDNIN